MDRWIVDAPGYPRLEGDIRAHEGFRGWIGGKHNAAFLLIDGRLCDAHKQNARISESRRCSTCCKRAHPLTPCLCICGGENHGAEYDGYLPTNDEESDQNGPKEAANQETDAQNLSR